MFDLRKEAMTNGAAMMQFEDTTIRLETWHNAALHWRLTIGRPNQIAEPSLEWAIRYLAGCPDDAGYKRRDRGVFKNLVLEWITVQPCQLELQV